MAEVDIDATWLDELAAKLEGMTTKDLPQIERAGLREVNNVVKPALIEAAPIAEKQPSPLSTALPIGKLKGAVRARVLEPRNGLGRAAVVDFGKYNYVANWVDGGHALVRGGRKGKGTVIGHVPAHPFIRAVQDTMQSEAEEAMVAGAEEEISRVMNEQ